MSHYPNIDDINHAKMKVKSLSRNSIQASPYEIHFDFLQKNLEGKHRMWVPTLGCLQNVTVFYLMMTVTTKTTMLRL